MLQGALSGLRWWPFIILAGAGAAVFLDSGRPEPALTMLWALVLAIGLAIAVFLELVARFCQSRQRLATGFEASPEAVRAILDATAGLTRVMSIATILFMALVALPQTHRGSGLGFAIGLGTAIFLGAMAWSMWSFNALHRRLERAGELRGIEGWKGTFYSNAKDPRIWVPKVSGVGTTLNFAHPRAWLILGAILALSLGAAALGLVVALPR